MRKNRYCLNTKLTEEEFSAILWRYSVSDNQTQIVQEAAKAGQQISRQTVSRFCLMMGDYFFYKNMRAEFENKKWPLGLLAFYYSIYPDREIFKFDDEMKESISLHQSNKIRVGLHLQFRNYSKSRRGVPLNRFCAHVGTVIEKVKFGDELYKKGKKVSEVFQEEFYYAKLMEFINNPIDPTSLISFHFVKNSRNFRLIEYKGSQRVNDSRFYVL